MLRVHHYIVRKRKKLNVLGKDVSGQFSFWGGCWNEHVTVPAQWEEDSRCAFLITSTHGRLLVLGVNPFTKVRCTGFADGDYLWDLSLGQCTGDGKFDGETFLGRLLIFFLGQRGRGRGGDRASTDESFSEDDV
jgi:hypothetical protein